MADFQLRILCIGAHPDDCELQFGGTAAKFAALGHAVKFVAVTNGDAGHPTLSGTPLAQLRAQEAEQAARRLGINATEVLDHHDGQLVPTLAARWQIVRQIRSWQADLVLTHRPYDYHPDHRYTAQLVQDSAYLVVVPKVCPDVAPSGRNPVFLYLEDHFRRPVPFAADITVDIGDVWQDPSARPQWLSANWSHPPCGPARAALASRYGVERAREIQHSEDFELCEYGQRPSAPELEEMLPR